MQQKSLLLLSQNTNEMHQYHLLTSAVACRFAFYTVIFPSRRKNMRVCKERVIISLSRPSLLICLFQYY